MFSFMRIASRNDALLFAHALLGFWLGIYAFRAYVPAAVWNLSDALPLYLKGALAVGVHALGVLGAFTPWVRRRRSAFVLAVITAIVGVLRQIFMTGDVPGSALSLAGWIVWLWWFAAFVRGAARIDVVVIAFAAAFAFQTGLQTAWHGLDLPLATGAVAIACAAILHLTFAGLAWFGAGEVSKKASAAFIAIGSAFFLELTLLANVGRIGEMTELSLLASALLIQAAITAGVLLAALHVPKQLVALAGVVLVVLLTLGAHGASAAIILFAAQTAIVAAMAAAARTVDRSPTLMAAAGSTLPFILVFVFYNAYELPALWIVSALIIALGALAGESAAFDRRYVPYTAASAVLSLFALLPPNVVPVQREDALHVLTYNIHQGYDAFGTPAMQRIADEIAALNADVIALQEVGRGWNFVGGADLVAYLRHRFPDYTLHFIPTNGALWGVALLSRLPVAEVSGAAFDAEPGVFRYGYAKAVVAYDSRAIPILSVHLTAGLEGHGESGRVGQMAQLLAMVAADTTVVVAGDFNAHPQDEPIRRVLAHGFVDAGAAAGLAEMPTWPASAPAERIDYVFVKGNLKTERGEIKRSIASDHLPVSIVLR